MRKVKQKTIEKMKRLGYNKFILLYVALVLSAFSVSAEELTKQVTRSFALKKDTRIEIENRYGNVIINKWDKDVFDLKVSIEAKGSSDSKSQKILDAISIDINDKIATGLLSVNTEIDQINGNSSFSINYEINIPGSNPMKLTNSFGNVFMGSYDGDLELTVKYGQLMAEDLDNANIRVEFSSAKCEIETLKAGALDIRYSKMEIEDMGDVDIASQFSELEIETAGDVKLDGRYGKFEIEKVKSLTGELQFSGLDIEKLEESIQLETKHGNGINLEKVSRQFKKIDINGQFSSININMESGAEASLEFELQFGNLRANGSGINFNKVIKDNTSSEYEGYLGKSNAASSIRVITKYGNIKLEVG